MNTKSHSPSGTLGGNAPIRVDTTSSVCGGVAMAGVAVFALICVAVEFIQTDINWFTTPISLYVLGPYGIWVQVAFFAPAPGFAMLGFGWYRTLERRARCMISLALFVAAGVSLCFTGAFVTDTTPSPVTIHGEIHQWSAFAAFVFITTGMTLQSWWFRMDPHWRKHFLDAFALAMISIVYFWIYALFKSIPRGLGEKVVIGLVLLWVWRAGWWLVRDKILTGDD